MIPEADNIQWIPILAALLGGGAVGAIITAVITRFRNRRQPIGYRKQVFEVFRKREELPSLEARITLKMPISSRESIIRDVDELAVVRIMLVNKGNQDIAEFRFGVTLGGTNLAIDVRTETPDRHHIAETLTTVGLGEPKNELDFKLTPFNRGEQYSVDVYFIYVSVPGPIELSSSHSTKFVEIGFTGEMIKTVGTDIVLGFLPIRIPRS